MRRTKILATIGPATSSPEMLRRLIECGIDGARITMSHASQPWADETIRALREASKEVGRRIAVLVDLQGPRLRLGDIPAGKVELEAGQTFTLTAESVPGDDNRVSVSHAGLAAELQPGDRILIDNGLVELRAESVSPPDIVTKVVVGGAVGARKGLNLPGRSISLPSITDKDRGDLAFALKQDVDWIAVSFVRRKDDLEDTRSLVRKLGGNVLLMAKIEKHEALEDLEGIIQAADGVMIARGDLAIETSTQDVPIFQKEITALCLRLAKPVVTATQMLESMVENPRPTRAEASDVANAVFEETDAVMLSEETATGCYPAQSVVTMASIAQRAEASIDYGACLTNGAEWAKGNTTDAISFAACEAARDINASAIVSATQSGATARHVARFRPATPIVAVTPRARVANQLALSWGVLPLVVLPSRNMEDMIEIAGRAALESGAVEGGEEIVVTAGVKVNVPGTTNLIQVHRV